MMLNKHYSEIMCCTNDELNFIHNFKNLSFMLFPSDKALTLCFKKTGIHEKKVLKSKNLTQDVGVSCGFICFHYPSFTPAVQSGPARFLRSMRKH